MSKLWLEYKDINTDLEKVKSIIQKTNKTSEKYLNDSVDYLVLSGGKMLRPAFLIIGSQFGQEYNKKESLLQLAASIEMMHLATLIHDDIIDESFLRRGKETIQSKYSKEYAVYMGDFLFSQCFASLVDFDFDPTLLRTMAKGIARVCTGEMMQSHLRYNTEVTKKQYLRVITGKTAVLFAVSLAVGAYYGKASESTVAKLARIGLNVGRAFQLIDDLLDYTGDVDTIGKDAQADIVKGYYTLPIILTLNSTYCNKTKTLLEKSILSADDAKHLIQYAHSSGAIQETQNLAKHYTQKAVHDLKKLPDSIGKKRLLEIIPKLLERTF